MWPDSKQHYPWPHLSDVSGDTRAPANGVLIRFTQFCKGGGRTCATVDFGFRCIPYVLFQAKNK